MATPVALLTLVCLLYSCVPAAISSEPLEITITKDGSDEEACLSGKIPCKTFDYACRVDGRGSDVTMIITYPQQLSPQVSYCDSEPVYGGNIIPPNNTNSLKIIGQVGDDYTFTGTEVIMTVCVWSPIGDYRSVTPKNLYLENIHIALPLTVSGPELSKAEFKGYIGQLLDLGSHIVTIENSILIGGIPSITLGYYYRSPKVIFRQLNQLTIKNSTLISNDTMLKILYAPGWIQAVQKFEIFIENTNFKFGDDPSSLDYIYPPAMTLHLNGPYSPDHANFTAAASINITISKCEFSQFQDQTNTLVVDMANAEGIVDVYFSILDSIIYYKMGSCDFCSAFIGNSIVVNRRWRTRGKVYTKATGNTMKLINWPG